MDLLQVKHDRILDARGTPVRLRGPNIGGYMMMENFIDGFPGPESGQRAAMAEVLGPSKAQFFFNRWLDYIFAEDDVRFLKDLGATVIRLPVNYRQFERDESPFVYLESGFARLNQVLDWCARSSLYVVLDMHAVQGWQNTDWHCDNDSRHTYFWSHKQFQDRFFALWQEIARRCKGNATVAGYGLMNEPVTNAPSGRFHDNYRPNYDVLNAVYRQGVNAIRAVDPDHIIFLEGDLFSVRFAGLDAPFAENLVYCTHNYNVSTQGTGPYPGTIDGSYWDRDRQVQVLREMEGTQFAEKYQVPLWVSEYGAAFNGPPADREARLKAMDDQTGIFEQYGVHWSNWTYKDIGMMGMLHVHPESDYMQLIQPLSRMKLELHADHWMGFTQDTNAVKTIYQLADIVEEVVGDPDIDTVGNHRYLMQHTLCNYVGTMLQPYFARQFRGLSEERIDAILSSFALRNCLPQQELLDMLRRYMTCPA